MLLLLVWHVVLLVRPLLVLTRAVLVVLAVELLLAVLVTSVLLLLGVVRVMVHVHLAVLPLLLLALLCVASLAEFVANAYTYTPPTYAPPLYCPADEAIRVTPAFIGQQYGFNPVYQEYEYRDYSTKDGSAYYANAEQVPIAAVGGFFYFETDRYGNDIAEWYSPYDVQSLITSLAYDYPVDIAPVLYVNDSNGVYEDNGFTPAVEASLDIDALVSICPQCRSGIFPIVDPSDGFFLDVFVDIFTSDDPPMAASASYTYGCDSEACLGSGFTAYYDSIFQQLGSIGVSVMISSGDDGPNNFDNALCNYTYAADYQPGTFMPGYPPSSPYVTTVERRTSRAR